MNLFRNSLFTLLFIGIFTFSNAQSKLLKYIPADATFVISMNPNNLNSKVNLRQLKEYDFYNMAMMQLAGSLGDGSEQVMGVLSDPETIGFDIMSSSHMFARVDAGKMQFGFLFNISDESKFSSFLKEMNPEGFSGDQYSKLPNYQLLKMGDDGWFGWNSEMAFIGSATITEPFDWEDENAMENRQNRIKEMTADLVTETMNRSKDKSILTHAKYKMATAKPADMHLWMDYSFISEMMEQGMMDEMPADFGGFDPAMMMGLMKSFSADTHLSMGLNFDNGQISMKTEMFPNREMLELNKGMADHKFNKKLVRYIRGEELLGYMSMSVSTEKMMDGYEKLIRNQVQNVPMYGDMINGAMDIAGIFYDETAMPNLFRGDFVMAFTGMQKVKRTITDYEYDEDFNATEIQKEVEQNIPEVTMIWTHSSKKDWMKFIRLGVKSSFLEATGDYYKVNVPGFDMDAFIALKDNMLFMTNSADLVNNRLSKGYKKKQRIGKKHCEMMSQNTVAFHWDIPNTLSVVGSEMGAGVGEFVNMGKQNFESIQVMSSRDIGNSVKSEFNINFVKKDVNSMKQIFEMINEAFMGMMGGSNS